MKYSLSIILILLSFLVKGQTQDSLVGDWRFKDIYKSTDLDSTKSNTLKAIFAEMKIHLKKDNTYIAEFMSREEGLWYFDPELRAITLISEKGEDKINVIEISSTTLTIELDRGKKLIFAKKLM